MQFDLYHVQRQQAEWHVGEHVALYVMRGYRPCSVHLSGKEEKAGLRPRVRVQIHYCEGVEQDRVALEIVADAVIRMRGKE